MDECKPLVPGQAKIMPGYSSPLPHVVAKLVIALVPAPAVTAADAVAPAPAPGPTPGPCPKFCTIIPALCKTSKAGAYTRPLVGST